MTLEDAKTKVRVLKRFISLLWICDTFALELAYRDLETAEEEYRELAFGGVLDAKD